MAFSARRRTAAMTPEAWAKEIVAPLREGLAGEGGSLVVERAPVELQARGRRVGTGARALAHRDEAPQGGVRSARDPQPRPIRGRAVSTATAGASAFDTSDAPSMDGLRACVHCGICLPQCPTYRVLGEEMDSPRGRIYLMRAAAEGRIGLTPTIARHLDLCLGCRGCESACPSGVPFGQLLEATRGQLVRKGVRAPESDHATTRWALETFPHPSRLAPLLWGLRLYQASGIQTFVRASGLLAPFRKLKAMESLLPAVASAGTLPEFIPARGKTRGGRGCSRAASSVSSSPTSTRARRGSSPPRGGTWSSRAPRDAAAPFICTRAGSTSSADSRRA